VGQSRQVLARIAGNAIRARLAYFRARQRASNEEGPLVREADALLGFLRRSGCSFYPCSTLVRNAIPMGVAYRYDIHARDIPGGRLLAEFHRRHKIPATFFLFWDYSPFERSHFRYYRDLGNQVSEPLEIGLHDSPIDAFLIKREFGGNRGGYDRWTDSGDAQKWLAELTSQTRKLANLNRSALEDFLARVLRTRAHFGPFSLVAPHGGELWQNLRRKLEFLEPAVAATLQSLRARIWLTPERLAAAGLELSFHKSVLSSPAWREISDDGGKLLKMAQALRQRLRTATGATQMLLHPYTWTGGKRDAELSELLHVDLPIAADMCSQ
jgi:hypothetical protein